jgi:hypothetical protein
MHADSSAARVSGMGDSPHDDAFAARIRLPVEPRLASGG